jgi:hypothetical protein
MEQSREAQTNASININVDIVIANAINAHAVTLRENAMLKAQVEALVAVRNELESKLKAK